MIIFDGGFGTEAVKHGFIKNDDPLWSSRLLHENHNAVLSIHKSFLDAGADAISSNTYQASINGFLNNLGCTVSEAQALIKTAATLVKNACFKFWQHQNELEEDNIIALHHRMKPLACASLGPYAVCLSDGSEYTGSYVNEINEMELKSWHDSRLSLLSDENLDLYLFETIPALAEVSAVLSLIKEYPNLKFAISFSCRDSSHLCHGEKLSDAVQLVDRCESVTAIGINCTSPRFITPLVKTIASLTSKNILVMPNSGELWEDKRWILDAEVQPLHHYVPEWVENGVNWLGGCCRSTPDDIRLIKQHAYDTIGKLKM